MKPGPCGVSAQFVCIALMLCAQWGHHTYISPLSLFEQMQELEQRLLEAEQRAENAETQVTGVMEGGLMSAG